VTTNRYVCLLAAITEKWLLRQLWRKQAEADRQLNRSAGEQAGGRQALSDAAARMLLPPLVLLSAGAAAWQLYGVASLQQRKANKSWRAKTGLVYHHASLKETPYQRCGWRQRGVIRLVPAAAR